MRFHALLARSAWYAREATERHECLYTIIMSFKRKRSVLSIKDEQSINLRLERGEKGTNLSAEYGVSSQQISDIHKNTDIDKIMKFAVPFLLVPHYYCSYSRLSGLFRLVATSADNRGSTDIQHIAEHFACMSSLQCDRQHPSHSFNFAATSENCHQT